MSVRLPPAIFLMGPTAAGKTDLALALARVLPCELISVDSALVYRDMDIGTAKPSKAVLAEYPHQLIDIRDPAQTYSAAEFRADALQVMAAATARGRIPLLVGGTMLYFKALLEGLADMPAADQALRAELVATVGRLQRPCWLLANTNWRALWMMRRQRCSRCGTCRCLAIRLIWPDTVNMQMRPLLPLATTTCARPCSTHSMLQVLHWPLLFTPKPWFHPGPSSARGAP